MKELLEHLDDRIWDSNAPLAEKCDMGGHLNRIRNKDAIGAQIDTIINNINARLQYWNNPALRRNQRLGQR